MINISKLGSHAIIVQAEASPLLVALPNATPDAIAKLAGDTNSSTTEKSMRDVLSSLWNVIVQPVVRLLKDELHLPPRSRIWWCPTGALTHLPLHAAGNYNKRGQNLPDLFISSYTPTLTALLRSRAGTSTAETTTPNMVIVGQSNDPTLPTVGHEIQTIRQITPDADLLDGSDATTEAALSAISNHHWIHLACHGSVDESRPFQSHFSLSNGPLTLLDITRQNVPNGHLAFLSSCHSAEGNRGRPDEVLHLSAGVQFAGFRTVVGTLWAMDSEDGPDVARTFYSSVLKTGDSAAVALHRAVAELRRRRVPIRRWACFVHYGY